MNSDLLNVLFGGGLVATIGAAFKGVKVLMDGSHAKEREAIADLKAWREESNDARQQAEKERDYWRSWAGKCEYELERRGLPLPARPKAAFISDEEAT